MRSASDPTIVKPLSVAQPGDYLVSDPSLSYYFLRKVTTASTTNGQVSITTTQAALTDVVQQGQFGHVWGQGTDGILAPGGADIPSNGCNGALGGCFDLSGTLLNLVGTEGKGQ